MGGSYKREYLTNQGVPVRDSVSIFDLAGSYTSIMIEGSDRRSSGDDPAMTVLQQYQSFPTPEMMSQTPRDSLLCLLRGQEMHIPNLHACFDHWPQAVHPGLEQLRVDVDKWIEGSVTLNPFLKLQSLNADGIFDSLFPAGSRMRHTKSIDTPFFGATWWPYASDDALRVSTYLSIWVRLHLSLLIEHILISYIHSCLPGMTVSWFDPALGDSHILTCRDRFRTIQLTCIRVQQSSTISR